MRSLTILALLSSLSSSLSFTLGLNLSLILPEVANAQTPIRQKVRIDDDPLIVPSGDPVSLQNRQIHPLEALSMRNELQDLLGRVDSALNRAKADQSNTQRNFTAQSQAVNSAQQFLKSMPDLIQAGRFAEVRNSWQQIRQGLWKDYPTEPLSALPEVRAIWLDRGTIVAAGSEQGLTRIFDRMAASNVNTVFIETVNAGYTIYPSQVAPQQNPLTRNWDPLAAAVKLAKERRMEVHAWVWVFGVGNRRHNALVGKPANYIGPVLEAYPQWANRDQDGDLFAPEGKTYVDPANPEVQAYLLRLYREIVTKYDVDGLQLDYIRYPRQEPGQEQGYGMAGRQKFKLLTGVDPAQISPNDRSLWWMWTQFRAQQVSEFVTKVSKDLRQAKPRLILSAAVFPWEPLRRFNRIQQDWETWVAKGELDLLVPMTYVPETSRFVRQHVQPVIAGVGKSPVLVLPGVLIRDMPDIELLDQLQAVRDLPSTGYALFAAEHLRPSFEGILKNNRANQSSKVIPYRQPFTAAQIRYGDLRREWQSLLEKDSLWLRGISLEKFQQEAEVLEKALEGLNIRPDAAKLMLAKSSLDRLVIGLPNWLRMESLERPYRVSTWQNRLNAIASILRFSANRLNSDESAKTAIKSD
jgi:uncharacterized lipoprotein YddW (UPF0748 family)